MKIRFPSCLLQDLVIARKDDEMNVRRSFEEIRRRPCTRFKNRTRVKIMNKKIWDLYAPIYEKAMRADQKYYNYMYNRIPSQIGSKVVLEIATGPGLLAKHVASASKRMIATDYSEGMIKEAMKGEYPANLTFEVADATSLPYEDNSFDVVLIANALHVMPNPEKALAEIDRVLKDNGILIAPNFVGHKKSAVSKLWGGILKLAGIKFEHQWTPEEYLKWLEDHGWKVTFSKLMPSRISLMYAECERECECTAL